VDVVGTGALFCQACGQGLPRAPRPAPAPTTLDPAVGSHPAPVAWADQSWCQQAARGTASATLGFGPSSTSAGARPVGISLLAIVELVIGLVGLFVVYDCLYWAVYSITYEGIASSGIDVAMGLVYLANSIAAFVIASGVWSQRASVWGQAVFLSFLMIGLDIVSVLLWGLTGLDIVGLVVHASVLTCLNQNSVRRVFGRPATTVLQFAS
jgi:hypothetical protein